MDFEEAVKNAKKIESKALSSTKYDGAIDIIRAIDLDPEEYEDLDYKGLVNLYERLEKIKKASSAMYIHAPSTEVEKEEVKEVEERVKEISSEAIEEIKEEMVEKPPEEKPVPEKPIEYGAIEFEKPVFEEKKETAFKEPEKIEEELVPPKEEVKLEAPPPLPPILTEANEAGEQKFTEIEEHFKRDVKGKMDEITVKKKMLELTKELFKEKSVRKREKIKLEITVLKNMIIGGKKPTRKKVKTDQNALFETIVATQIAEKGKVKDSISTSYRKKIENLKTAFYEEISKIPVEEREKRNAAYEKFVFKLTSVSEHLPSETKKYADYLTKKHDSEVEKLEKTLKKGDKSVEKKAKERKDKTAVYEKEFEQLNNSLQKTIEVIMEKTGHDILGEEKKTPETEVSNTVYEINETDVGTLLFFLHSKDPEYYKKYERKKISKSDAVRRAKILMAKEKGLSEDMISKYLGNVEG